MASRPGRSRGRTGPPVGSLRTGVVIGQAKRGVSLDLGGVDVVLERVRYGAASWIDDATYGTPLTVEVVEGRMGAVGPAVSRVGVERALRQPRSIAGTLGRSGGAWALVPSDGAAALPALVIDRLHLDDLDGRSGTWSVGAVHRGVRLVLPPEASLA